MDAEGSSFDEVDPEVVMHDENLFEPELETRFSPDGTDSTTKLPRKYVFSTAVAYVCDGLVSLASLERLDAYQDQWNILNDDDLSKAKQLCDEKLDHGHFAPPCRTLTEARRTDHHGSAKVLRSIQYPEGWGDGDADEANRIVERMVMLCLILVGRGKTFSIENPFGSFLWLLRVMQKLMKLRDAELVLLHQCCYGAITSHYSQTNRHSDHGSMDEDGSQPLL